MNRRLAAAAALFLGFAAAACAPSGFVETTANVIDEMTAFRDARRANTREAWETFIRQYPDSSKAAQARQWLQTMGSGASDQEQMRAQVAKAEAERAERERAEKARREELAAKQAEEQRKAAEEAQRIADEKAAQQKAKEAAAALAQQQEVAQSTTTAALLAELEKRMAELDKREAELKAREDKLAAAAAAPVANDDVDTPPKKGLAQSDENFAVVIGVEKYRDIDAKAEFAERDARTMMLYLRDYLGFPEQNIKLLIGDRASLTDFKKIIELWLPLQVTDKSKVFVYFSGHGAPDPNSKQAYLLPWDADPKALSYTAYPVKDLYAKLNSLPAKDVMVALDSCFSGAGGRSTIAQGARPLMTKVETGVVDPTKNVTVFTAAAGEEITGAYEPQKHGLFTYYFLRGLRGDADVNHTGTVTVADEFAYLKKNVSLQANRDSRQQTPQLLPPLPQRRDKGALPIATVAP